MAVVTPARLDEFLAVCAKWDVTGHGHRRRSPTPGGCACTGTARRSSTSRRARRSHDGPVYQRPVERPARPGRRCLQHDGRSLPRPRSGDELRATAAAAGRLAEPRRPVLDHRPVRPVRAGQHRAGASRRTPAWSGSTSRQLAGSRCRTDGNGRYTRLDPYAGAQLALAEAYRNVAATGARPLAVTNCLNFGSPEDPAVMWQFAEAVRGLADGCQALGTPVTGGNVSFYNQTGTTAILPTPVVGVLGVIDDVRRRSTAPGSAPTARRSACSATRGTSSAARSGRTSCTATSAAGRRSVDLAARAAARRRAGHRGARTACSTPRTTCPRAAWPRRWSSAACAATPAPGSTLPAGADPFVALFSESAGRAVVSVPRSDELRSSTDLCAERGLPCTRIGVVDLLAPALDVTGQFRVPLRELRAAWSSTLPRPIRSESRSARRCSRSRPRSVHGPSSCRLPRSGSRLSCRLGRPNPARARGTRAPRSDCVALAAPTGATPLPHARVRAPLPP